MTCINVWNSLLLMTRKTFGEVLKDFVKVFDCLSHKLVARSNVYGCSMTAIRLAHNYLANNMRRTYINLEYHSCEEILFEVPHGFILRLLLLTTLYPSLLNKGYVLPLPHVSISWLVFFHFNLFKFSKQSFIYDKLEY